MPVIDMNDETIQTYLEESHEHLADIETNLLNIEDKGADIDEDLVNTVFRAAHSIKGGAGFFNLVNIRTLGHKIENVLDLIRSRKMIPTPDVINILLLSFDRLREMINSPAESNEVDIEEFVQSLVNLTSESLPTEEKKSLRDTVEIKLPDGRTIMHMSVYDYNQIVSGNNYLYLVDYDLMRDLQSRGIAPLEFYSSLIGTGTIENFITDFEAVGTLDDNIIGRIPVYLLFSTILKPEKVIRLFEVEESRITVIYSPENIDKPVKAPQVSSSAQTESPAETEIGAETASESAIGSPIVPEMAVDSVEQQEAVPVISEQKKETLTPPAALAKPVHEVSSSLRVKVDLLEQLMTLAGELVLGRNELSESISQGDMKAITSGGQRISQITSELQEAIMLTRMQDIGSILNKFPRVVRDMSRQLNKQINLKIDGKEVELDKTLLEGLNDPLTHMIRNSIDHGIESPEERGRAGKKAVGEISLKAYHEAGQVIIEVADDGKGIDGEVIAEKAVANGQISQGEADGMSLKAKTELILLPGLSTAEKITDVSGRGVGMDVVKSNLDKLGGTMDIESVKGKGSVFRIKLPLTLAIIPSLLVSVNKESFAVPQLNVEELIRIQPRDVKDNIERLGTTEVLNLRGKLIPLVFLSDVLGIKSTYKDPETGEEKLNRRRQAIDRRTDNDEDETDYDDLRTGKDRRYHAGSVLNIVIVSTGNISYGILVDTLHESMEIVVKPLGRHIKSCREYAGATIMGDGNVALILDIAGIAAMLKISAVTSSIRSRESENPEESQSVEEKHSYLLFRNSPQEYCAMPLELVGRVEHIAASQIEMIGGKRLMQYMGRGLPLVRLEDASECASLPDDDLAVIVFNGFGREIGLLAMRPVDFIEKEMLVDHTSLRQQGIMGSVIIDGKTTMILDVFEIVEAIYPEWTGDKNAVSSESVRADGKQSLILVADDSAFFRKQVAAYIKEAGFQVIAGEDGEAAWKLLVESEKKVDLLVTDIEMPNLDGYGLVKRIRGDSKYANLPVIAVTSLAGDENIEKGKAVGINDYQVKLDKEMLLESVIKFVKIAM